MTTTISQIDFLKRFSDDDYCIDYIENIRWGGKVICPFCECSKIYTLKANVQKYKCSKCLKKFHTLIGTIFEGTKIPISTWLFLIYSQSINKKNISSYQISRNLGLTQKTTWSILYKIRSVLTQDENLKLSGVVEIDECFVSKGNKWTRWGGISTRKAPILGMIERGGNVIIKTIVDRKRVTILKLIQQHVLPGNTIFTDGHPSYKSLYKDYIHDFVEHSTREYVRNEVHTNNIENIWTSFKRSIRYAHHSVSEKHIQSYCNETAWRHNNRNLTGSEKFNKLMQLCLNPPENLF